MPANGVTLAEQELVRYQGTTTEELTFIHQDASGSGAMLTDSDGNATQSGRTGEYDPLGRNVADPGPYITLDTEEPVESSGVDLFGSGEGYRPGRKTYVIDGLVVPESQFLQVINSSLIGGAFGLLEIAARMSAQVTVRTRGGRLVGTFANAGAIPDNFRAGIRQGELSASYKHNNWSVVASLIPQGQQESQPPSGPSPPVEPLDITWDQIVEGFKDCVRQYWGDLVTINSVTPVNNKGVNGTINLTYKNGEGRVITDTIINDATKFDSEGIEYFAQGWEQRKWPSTFPVGATGGVTFRNGPRMISGEIHYLTPLYNYTASNAPGLRSRRNNPMLAAAIGDWIYGQFHEGANAIDMLTGKYIGDRNGLGRLKDPDSGQRITNCLADKFSNGQ